MYNEQFVNVLIGCIMSHIVIGTLANRQIIKLLHMNRICNLFGIKYPIIQGGMVWCSGWRLASAVSNAGGLGLIGAGSMHPETLREHIQKCKAATDKPFGVNIPLMYPEIDILINMVIEEGVKIVFTSAGNPKTWTEHLHEHGIIVAHVVASTKFAAKCEEAGVDAIVAEGFEAGGHNGREETTTLCLIPAVRQITTCAVDSCRRYRIGRKHTGCYGIGGRRGTNRHALCINRREFCSFHIQRPVSATE